MLALGPDQVAMLDADDGTGLLVTWLVPAEQPPVAGAAEQKRRERNGTGWRREAVGRREAEVRRQERRKEELRVRLKTLEEEAMADGKRWPRRSGEHGGCVGGARRDPVSRRGEWVEVRVCRV